MHTIRQNNGKSSLIASKPTHHIGKTQQVIISHHVMFLTSAFCMGVCKQDLNFRSINRKRKQHIGVVGVWFANPQRLFVDAIASL